VHIRAIEIVVCGLLMNRSRGYYCASSLQGLLSFVADIPGNPNLSVLLQVQQVFSRADYED